MPPYQILYTHSFSESLMKLIASWQSLGFGDDQIQSFVAIIYRKILSLKSYPNRFQDVTALYDLEKPARRLLVGQYAIFYRVDDLKQIIYVGAIFSPKQMALHF